MNKIIGSILGAVLLLTPVMTFAQTATTTDYKAELISILQQLVIKLEAEIAQIISQQTALQNQQTVQGQQIQQIVQNTTPTPVFGSIQPDSTSTPVINPAPVNNIPTCTLAASTTPLKATSIAWTSINAQTVNLYWATGNSIGGIMQYAVLGIPDPAHPLNPTSGYEESLGNYPFKATFIGTGGTVDCFAIAN